MPQTKTQDQLGRAGRTKRPTILTTGCEMTKSQWIETEVRWLMSLEPDARISAAVPQEIVKVFMEMLNYEIESGRVKPISQQSRSKNPRVDDLDNTELLGPEVEP